MIPGLQSRTEFIKKMCKTYIYIYMKRNQLKMFRRKCIERTELRRPQVSKSRNEINSDKLSKNSIRRNKLTNVSKQKEE